MEYERVQQVRGAYNADKKVLVDRISELDHELKCAKEEREQLERRFSLLEQSAGTYRNEINYLQGKNATLKRDLEHQERYISKIQEEAGKVGGENDYLKSKIDLLEREIALFKKQVTGL